jgi:hypothetical protein
MTACPRRRAWQSPRFPFSTPISWFKRPRRVFAVGFVLRSSFSVPPAVSCKRRKSWCLFSRSRTLGRRLSDAAAAEPMSAKRKRGIHGPSGQALGPCGKRQTDRSDVRQEFARFTEPDPASSQWTSGRAPALHAASVSQPLPFDCFPSVLPMRCECGRFPLGDLTTPFIQRWGTSCRSNRSL